LLKHFVQHTNRLLLTATQSRLDGLAMKLRDHLAAIGSRGGSKNTIAQMEARDANLKKAREVRAKNLREKRAAKTARKP
jgi:hypothetical protein